MSYKITVTEIAPLEEGAKYPQEDKIYEQTVEDLDVLAVINAANRQALDDVEKL